MVNEHKNKNYNSMVWFLNVNRREVLLALAFSGTVALWLSKKVKKERKERKKSIGNLYDYLTSDAGAGTGTSTGTTASEFE